jgi:hypothetical protein
MNQRADEQRKPQQARRGAAAGEIWSSGGGSKERGNAGSRTAGCLHLFAASNFLMADGLCSCDSRIPSG